MLQMDTAVGEVLEKVGFTYRGERARDRIGAGDLVAGRGQLGSSRTMLLYMLNLRSDCFATLRVGGAHREEGVL